MIKFDFYQLPHRPRESKVKEELDRLGYRLAYDLPVKHASYNVQLVCKSCLFGFRSSLTKLRGSGCPNCRTPAIYIFIVNDEFLKVGYTIRRDASSRLSEIKRVFGSNVKQVLFEKTKNAKEIESNIKQDFAKYSVNKMPGYTECFYLSDLEKIVEFIQFMKEEN